MEGARFGDLRSLAPVYRRGLTSVWLGRLALVVAGVAALVTLVIAAQVVITGYVNVPFWDQWGYINDGSLWKQPFRHHNEHMILAARVFYTLDAILGGRQVFNLGTCLVIQLGAAASFALLARAGGLSRLETWLAFAMALCFTFSACQYDNFTWGFQVQFVGVFAGFVSGTLFAVQHVRTGRRRWLVLAMAAALFSACSMANGLAAAPLLCLLLLALGRWRAALAMAATAAVGLGLYAIGPFAPPVHVPGSPLSDRLWSMLSFGLTYLGTPFAWLFPGVLSADTPAVTGALAPAARLVGVGVVIVILAGLAGAVVGTREGRPGRFGLAAIILFGIASGAATVVGRTPLGIEGALPARYGTTIMTLVGASTLSIWLGARAWRPGGRAGPLVALGLSLVLLAFAIGGRVAVRPVTDIRLGRESAMLALAARQPNIMLLSRVTFAPQVAVPQSEDLRRHKRSVFAEPWAQAMGGPLSVIAPEGIGGICEGSVQAPPLGQSVYQGLAWAPHDQHPTRIILLANQAKIVVGVGRVRAGLRDILAGGVRRRHQLVDWIGVAGPDGEGRALSAYLLIDGGRRACSLGAAPAAAPVATAVAEPAVRTPLELVWAEQSGTFALFGAHPAPGPAPVGANAYGSWVGADSNTGKLTLEYKIPSQGVSAVVLPVVTGPIADGQSLVFRLRATGAVIGVADLAGATRWSWRRLALPPEAAGQILEVEAQDRGEGWGQWMGLGQAFAEGTPPSAR